MTRRNSLIFLTAFGLLLTGCGKSGLEITKEDILEVARDDANVTKSECENVSIKEQKGSYIVSFTTNGGSYEYNIGKDGLLQNVTSSIVLKKKVFKKNLLKKRHQQQLRKKKALLLHLMTVNNRLLMLY